MTMLASLQGWRCVEGHHPEGLPAPRDRVPVGIREEPLRQRHRRRAQGVPEGRRRQEPQR